MALNVVHDTLEEIPEAHRELYSEQGGKFILTGIVGVKTQDDITRLQTALEKERGETKAAKTALGVWGELNHEEVKGKLDRFDELELAAKDKIPDEKLEEMAEARARTRINPIERQNKQLTEERDALTMKLAEFQGRETRRTIHDNVRKQLIEQKVVSSAHEDALMLAERVMEITEDGKVLTKDGVGVTPGIDPGLWLSEMQPKREHWWTQSVGGGAGGGSSQQTFGKNPWSEDHWNLSEQGRVYREQGKDKAEMMASAAKSKIGATAPTKAK